MSIYCAAGLSPLAARWPPAAQPSPAARRRDHRGFRLLFLASVVDNLGAWLSYVSLLGMVERFSGGSGLALSAVVLIRFLPALLLGPVAGVVADRCAALAQSPCGWFIIMICFLLP